MGTKSDMRECREVSEQEITKFSEKYNLKYIETSAKMNENVALAFETITHQVFAHNKNNNSKSIQMKLSVG